MRIIAVTLLLIAAMALAGCATAPTTPSVTLHHTILIKQTVERIDYLASPGGNRYILEQISHGGPVW